MTRSSLSSIILITGCSSGIGHALAIVFRRQGHTIWATARDPKTLTDLATQGIHTTQLNVTHPHSRTAAI